MGIPLTQINRLAPQAYLVGGAVRDVKAGLAPKDFDFTVEAEDFDDMIERIESVATDLYLVKPEFATVRASVHRDFIEQYVDVSHSNRTWLPADFVLARKDGYYADGRRPESVARGTILDDLARRDFTVNAMALSSDGTLLDPHHGNLDLARRMLVTVGRPTERFTEDALRVVRALRFAVTKGFSIAGATAQAMQSDAVLEALKNNIAVERIQQELERAFRFDTMATFLLIAQFTRLSHVLLDGDRLWLKPTLEEK